MRTLSKIALEIKKEWPKPYFGAVPYLQAMVTMGSIDEDYGCDSGESVVLYFLSNAGTWRGEAARRIKAELNAMVKSKNQRRRSAESEPNEDRLGFGIEPETEY